MIWCFWFQVLLKWIKQMLEMTSELHRLHLQDVPHCTKAMCTHTDTSCIQISKLPMWRRDESVGLFWQERLSILSSSYCKNCWNQLGLPNRELGKQNSWKNSNSPSAAFLPKGTSEGKPICPSFWPKIRILKFKVIVFLQNGLQADWQSFAGPEGQKDEREEERKAQEGDRSMSRWP